MEEERAPLAVVRELDLPEEERVVAAPVRANDACDEVSERACDERGLVDDLERRLGDLVGNPAGEAVGEICLVRLEHAHSEPRALVHEGTHPRASVDRDEHERR